MSEASLAKKDETSPVTKDGLLGSVAARLVGTINQADEQAAARRVEKLRKKHPAASDDQLIEMLIKQKCLQAGAVGAVTSGAGVIPGLGTAVSLTFGVAADIGMTYKLQAELVLEIASALQRELTLAEKRNIVMAVTGVSAGANQVLSKVGNDIAEKATERLAQKSIAKAIPVLGVGASAGVNILSTYYIGRRAQAYFKLGPEAMEDWRESTRAITGIDERKIIAWLTETTEHSWNLASSRVKNISGAMIVAGQSLGEVVVSNAGKAGRGTLNRYMNFVGAVVRMDIKIAKGIASGIRNIGLGLKGLALKRKKPIKATRIAKDDRHHRLRRG